jgi:carboxymethylenebutenolidase
MTAGDFPPDLLAVYDGYVHGRISKREFLDRAARFTVAGLSAAALIEALRPDYALAQQIGPDDARIEGLRAGYDAPRGHGRIEGLLVKPAGQAGKRPGVLVVHENRGLNPYIEDVARRVAVAGYVAFAPDGLSSLGGYPGDDDTGREMQAKLDPARLMQDFFAGYEYLAARADVSDRTGCVGFCYGGGVCNALAVAYPKLCVSVPFYGLQPPVADVPRIQAALLLHYAGLDARVNAGWPAYKEALDAGRKTYAAYIYPGVNHGFHNDSTPRYDAAAATLAWSRTLDAFQRYLDP